MNIYTNKSNQRLISVFAFIIASLLWGCDDYLNPEPFARNSTNPPKLESTAITRISGGAKINYVLPSGYNDLLYVKATYTRNGEIVETKASRYDNSLYIRGLRDTTKFTNVKLVVGNDSGLESEPITVKVKPKSASIDVAIETILVEETFGGVRLRWDNPTLENTIVKVFSYHDVVTEDEDTVNVLSQVLSADTKLIRPDYKIRGEDIGGYDPIETEFGFLFQDIYGNQTDTLFLTRVPIHEEFLEPARTDLFPFRGLEEHSAALAAEDPTLTWDGPNYGDRHSAKLFDGKWKSNGDAYWAVAHDVNTVGGQNAFKNKKTAFVTLDLQQPSNLSRYKLYGLDKKDFNYNESAPRKWKIWVTPALTKEEAQQWGPDSSWEVVDNYTIADPVDGKTGKAVTEQDHKTWKAGWEIDLSTAVEYPVRYIRIQLDAAWTSSVGGGHIGEFQIYGTYANSETDHSND